VNDGSWRAVWSLNATSPCFAAAFSDDLTTWRPQDYPITTTKGIEEPIVFACDDGSADIYYRSKEANDM